MFIDFVQKLCKNMIASGFQISGSKKEVLSLSNQTEIVILYKKESQIIYIAAVMNANLIMPQTYEYKVSSYLDSVKAQLSGIDCNFIVCISIVVSDTEEEEIKNYVVGKEWFPGEVINRIWWYIPLDKENIYRGDSQPDKILNIQKIIQQSKEEEKNMSTASLAEIENLKMQNRKIDYESKHSYCVMGLLVINIAILVYMLFTDSMNLFAYRFGTELDMVIEQGQYYRLITSMFIHGGISHCAFNMTYLYAFGTKIEKIFGSVKFLILYFIAGLCGSVASLYYTQSLSVGASGAIYGLIGAIFAYSRKYGTEEIGFSYITILSIIVFGIVMGYADPQIDNFAHIGGLIAGYCFGYGMLVEKKET